MSMLHVPEAGAILDRKTYIKYDSQIGYRYDANVDLVLPKPGGGTYHFQTNAQGIRSSREYAFKKPPGVTRVIVCGDSMSAGQFVSNDQRLSEQLERRIPGLEVINLSLEGSGTDQQLLIYESVGLKYEHDMVLLMPFLSNVGRNLVSMREGFDAAGKRIMRGKPFFELGGGRLELRNVPVPDDISVGAQSDRSEQSSWRQRINAWPGMWVAKSLLYRVVPWEPFPEFRSEATPGWQLMRAIILRFKASAGGRPLVIAPTFYDNYVRYRMSRKYWDRFSGLADIPGIHVIDLLPHLKRLGPEALRCFQSPYDVHFSSYGHLVVADALAQELSQRGLLPAQHMSC